MISGVRASSMRIESTSSTIAKLGSRCMRSSRLNDHVVAQIVEAEFVVGAIGDVGCVGFALALRILPGEDHADVMPRKR
jgi:hypothetical protein